MKKAQSIILCGLISCSFILSGCSSVRDIVGASDESPDEFAVMTRAPLSIPSELTLPPPMPGAQRPQEVAATKQAQRAVLGDDTIMSDTQISDSENSLLQNAGAAQTDPNIRSTVNQETEEMHRRNQPVAQKLLSLTKDDTPASATIVDAKKELERIQKNKEDGKSVTEGKTPYIEQ